MKKIITILGLMLVLMVGMVSAYNGDICTETNAPCGGGCTSTDMTDMFRSYNWNTDSNGYGDITGWDTSCITDMRNMFRDSNLNQDISSWDTSNVIDFNGVFQSASFNIDISDWNVSSGEDFSNMFYGSNFNQPIGSWDVSSGQYFNNMFRNTGFNQNINAWDMTSAVSISTIFQDATAFNQPLNDWDTPSLTSAYWVFYGATSFNQPIDAWDMSSVTSITNMFHGATSFNQPLNNWDIGRVGYMNDLFHGATSFNQPLNNWDTSRVNNMISVFDGAISFDQNLGSWNVERVGLSNSFKYMFRGVNLSVDNYNGILLGWSTQDVNLNQIFDAGLSQYTDQSSKSILEDLYGWTITDGGLYNTQPIINSLIPNVDFLDNEVQLYTIDLLDVEGDAAIVWDVDGVVVSACDDSLTCEISGGDYSLDLHTLAVTVSDADYFDSTSVNFRITASNTEPVINSITPSSYVELTNGESQTFTSDVTDEDGDAVYNWELGGIGVSTTETYTANWDDIEPGIYTLELVVSDSEFSDIASTTLEIRAKGGSGSFSLVSTNIDTNPADDIKIAPEEQEQEQENVIGKFFNSIGDFFKRIF